MDLNVLLKLIARRGALLGMMAAVLVLSACASVGNELATVLPTYSALPGHKALVVNTNNQRFVWVSDKGSQLDAIQMAQILCTHASNDTEACFLVYVDDHKVYDPVKEVALPPDSKDLADVLYEASADSQGSKDSGLSSVGDFFGF